VEDQPAPDRNDEYLHYQTLLGAWPAGPLDREAKVHTSWVNPNEEYDAAVRQFVGRLLPDTLDGPFREDLLAFQRRIAYFGYFNSLSQVLLALTSPGVPDLYQGSELWDFSLVDPDNRRAVDYARRSEILANLRERISQGDEELVGLVSELLDNLEDGRIKLYLTHQTLTFRREHASLFAGGTYLPLDVSGAKREHVCAFARCQGEEAVLVVVPRLMVRLTGGGERPPLGPEVWGKTRLLLPSGLAGRSYRNIFTGEVLELGGVHNTPEPLVAAALGRFPVALLTSHPTMSS
jgi:(1->4)-alpha-D-glucan 1-alpha-D-glucosylmutase